MQIETLGLDALIPYARNSRTHSDEQVAQIAASIREFGFTNPVLIDADGGIIAGHGRVLGARKLGLAEVPCIRLGHLSEAQRRAYVIADNKLALNAGWDDEMLGLELRDLQGMDYDLGLTGFEQSDIDALLAGLDATPEGATDADAVPEVQAEVVTKLGDVWVMGKHRVMCGDSTDAGAVALLMNGEKAALMQTDPPYGIAYNSADIHAHGVDYGEIENDDILDGEKLQAFLEAMIRAALPALNDNAAYYLWHPMLTQGTFFAAAAAAAAAVLIHRQIIWVKPVLVFGRGDYHWKHELCFYGWRRGNRPPFYGERNQTTVWHIDSVTQAERKEFRHASPKPVALWLSPIENHTKAGEIMFEPFSGSGGQIIAAEQTGRRCYAMELSQQYVDVTVRRWQQFTGKRATLESTGEPFPS
jgi:DNA modification methylase